MGVGHGDRSAELHRGEAVGHVLDLLGRDLLAAPVDLVR
jgi:hypothetical protein